MSRLTSIEFQQKHGGESLSKKRIMELAGTSRTSIDRWVEKGHLQLVDDTYGKRIYYIPPLLEEMDVMIQPTETKEKDTQLPLFGEQDSDLPDLTDEISKHPSVSAYLKAVSANKAKVKHLHSPLDVDISDAKSRKILSLSDLHVPFHDKELIQSICEEHSDADIVVLNGDIMEAYAASTYSQDKLISILEEYTQTMDLLIWLGDRFPEVHLVKGNHEDRVDRYFSQKMDPHMMALANKDILWRLQQGHLYNDKGKEIGTYKYRNNNIFYQRQGDPHSLKIGKTLFMHPSNFSNVPAGTVVKLASWVDAHYPNDSYDSIVLGHTHKVAKLVEKSKLLIEQGCLTHIMDYQKKGTLAARPSVQGYAVIWQDEHGNTDFNKSNFCYAGTLDAR